MADPLIHPHETLTTPAGDDVEIDLDMVPVVHELWRLCIKTTACCQDVGEATAGVREQRDTALGYGGDAFIAYHRGWALLKLPVVDALRLVELLAASPTFGDRVGHPWRPGSWRMNVPLVRDGIAPDALLHFPREQLHDLAATLRTVDT